MEKIRCQHIDLLSIPKEEKLRSQILKQNTHNRMFKCLVCDDFSPKVWICLEENCIFTGCDQDIKFHLFYHLEETRMINNIPHCLFLNPFSTKIFCFECNCEVHDFELLGIKNSSLNSFDGPLDPSKVRDSFAAFLGYLKEGDLKYTESIKNAKNCIEDNKGISGLVNLGNTSHLNAMIQIFAQVPSINHFYGTLYQNADKTNIFPAGSTKKLSYLFAELICNIWSGTWRLQKPNDLMLAFFDLYPSLRGYGYKDIHETYRSFLNAIHEEHRILIPKPFELGLRPVLNNDQKQHDWEIVSNLGKFLENSIITDTFQGKMYSNFQCENCKEALSLEDYFTYLDLKIPNEKDPQRLKKWNIGGDNTIKSPSNAKEPSFHIYEALAEFFEVKFMKKPGNLYCEKCQQNTPYQKYYRFLNLPNMLCLHIKRKDLKKDQNWKVVLELDELDLTPFVKESPSYMQEWKKYELIGYIENLGDDERPKYTATIKNCKSNQWFTMLDHEIMKRDEKTINENLAIMVFYKRKFDSVRLKEAKNLKSNVELLQDKDFSFDPNKLVYLPNYWFEKATSLANPGMIHTWHLLCKHGKIKPSYRDCFLSKSKNLNTTNMDTSFIDKSFMDKSFITQSATADKSVMVNPVEFLEESSNDSTAYIENQSIQLPEEIGEYFLERYGGGPLIKGLNICQECFEEAINIKTRKRRERKIISLYDNEHTQINYAVSKEWIESWKNFLYVNTRFLRRNFLNGYPPPGPVNNSTLYDENGKINLTLEKNFHYRVVNAYVWKIFVELYGADKEVKLNGRDINSFLNPATKVEVELRPEDMKVLEELKALIKFELPAKK